MKLKEYLNNVVTSKEAKAKELREAVKASEDVNEVRALGETLQAVLDELADAKAQLEALEAEEVEAEAKEAKEAEAKEATEANEGRSAEIKVAEKRFNPVSAMGFDVSEKREENKEDTKMEERANKFAETGKMTIGNDETRAVLVSSGKIATPTGVAGINDGFNKVSSIVDQVTVEDCTGMGEFKVAFEAGSLMGSKFAEGAEITEKAGPDLFKYATIKPHQIAVLTYISNQVLKQSPLQYEAKVRTAALNALRAKAASLILTGDDSAGFEGINTSENVKKLADVTAIDEKTLRKIVMNYGGNENIAQGATLYLNKLDLIAFGDVRGSDKKPVYKITPNASNPNTGVIEDGGLVVPYTINSSLKALSDENVPSMGDGLAFPAMIYGQPQNFTLGLFGNYEIKVSEDFAFNKNMLAIRGVVDLGGAVCHEEGFVVVPR